VDAVHARPNPSQSSTPPSSEALAAQTPRREPGHGVVADARRADAPLDFTDPLPKSVGVLVVGGGVSGLATAARILECTAHWPRDEQPSVAVVEREPRPAPGVAYGGCDAEHLLNVPAARMGLDPDDPTGFHRWLLQRYPGRFAPGDFAERALYGRYLNETMRARLAPSRHRLALVRDRVVDLAPDEGDPQQRLRVECRDGGRTFAAAAVLALGLPESRPCWSGRVVGQLHERTLEECGRLLATPWSTAEETPLDQIKGDDAVLVVGSGLTAIDVVAGLVRRGHRGRIDLVSRHGRLPLPHAPAGQPAPSEETARRLAALPKDIEGLAPKDALALVRAAARSLHAEGITWHAAIDALRPRSAAIWRRWNDRERARFLASLRPFWEVHRHRAPSPLLDLVHERARNGLLGLHRGTLESLGASSAAISRLEVRAAGRMFEVHRVVDCTGPARSLATTADPLLAALLGRGDAVTDAAGLGLETDDDGRLRTKDGALRDLVFVVGALRRGSEFESTAVPELRVLARTAADAIVALVTKQAGTRRKESA
jgi:uncharacterized NAD(P)/FAD-binding protein YdhS